MQVGKKIIYLSLAQTPRGIIVIQLVKLILVFQFERYIFFPIYHQSSAKYSRNISSTRKVLGSY